MTKMAATNVRAAMQFCIRFAKAFARIPPIIVYIAQMTANSIKRDFEAGVKVPSTGSKMVEAQTNSQPANNTKPTIDAMAAVVSADLP